MRTRTSRIVAPALIACIAATAAIAAELPAVAGLPGAPAWENQPASWHMDTKQDLTISAGAKTDWFVDPFDGTVARNAPILLFQPAEDYVLSTRVAVKFKTKWDAGALMVMGDDHHWAKLSFELSPDGKPTLVTVVTRGFSDDSNSRALKRSDVFLRIAKTGRTFVFRASEDGHNWEILRTFSLDTDLPLSVGFEAQSPAGTGATARFSAISYTTEKTGNIYK